MPITRNTISLEWLTEQNACNLEVLKQYFESRGVAEFDLTPEGIRRALQAGILSSNWLARRILTGPELERYNREMIPHMKIYESAMSQVLIEIITDSS